MTPASDLTIGQLLEYLLPLGTRGTKGEFTNVPLWPLDLFGIAAYLVQQSDCQTRLLEHGTSGVGEQFSKIREQLVEAGLAWRFISDIDSSSYRTTVLSLEKIHDHWKILLQYTDCTLKDCRNNDNLVLTLLALIAMADEACESVGFFSGKKQEPASSTNTELWIPAVFDYISNNIVLDSLKPYTSDWCSHLKLLSEESLNPGDATSSGCLLIPYDRLCVLPKSHTPALGCTLRSLTHNLALHTSATQVKSFWLNYQRYGRYEVDTTLNVLIVPIPYSISPNDFNGHDLNCSNYRGFTLKQSWLDPGKKDMENIYELLRNLITRSIEEGAPPNIIVFPESALNPESHQRILEQLAEDTRLKQLIVIAGISDTEGHQHKNYSSTAYISDHEIKLATGQTKHHRWKLDKHQISTYSLESSLTPEHDWWELTEVKDRAVRYHVFNNGACISTLICEDLARTDPCKPSINASAPNLVFALLMDGPQVASRWPGRYALGLADDPGSAVLTVSSLGLIERSNWRYNNTRQTIALWGGGDCVKELDLPINKQALILTIEKKDESLVSLDGRVSDSSAVRWSYKALKAV